MVAMMNHRVSIICLVLLVVLMIGCKFSFADEKNIMPWLSILLSNQSPDTTTYCHGEFNRIIIESREDTETYEVVFAILSPNPQPATGARSGNTLRLNATIQGFDLTYTFTFRDNDQNIEGRIHLVEGGQSYIFNEWGVRGPCPTVDVESDGVPHFISSDFVDLANQIQDISLFRSAAGHNFSDGFESCRSMKHYFSPPPVQRANNTVSIFSPVAGRIVHLETEEENFIDDGVTNQKVIIQPDDQPAFLIILFHVDLLGPTLVVGTHLSAGQHIGYGRLVRNGGSPSHDFDIVLDANTDEGIRYISYINAMTDSLFNGYAVWGGGTALRDDFIISRAARDADPLTCSGDTFTSFGSLPSWYYNLP